ncbi:MAG: HlyD family efflux transporter periplasmic adaptor subunit [Clostridium sp.]|nr:HlyD family efflux transporter periplasmic adaptor subunit [Clostridium sp.]
MDREIPIAERRRQAKKKWIIASCSIVGFLALIWIVNAFSETSIKEADLNMQPAQLGALESSVSASGKLVPLYEQTIVSPVSTRILEIYCNEGDSVAEGQSLLRLDLQTAEGDYKRLMDEVAMKSNEIEQTRLSDRTSLTNLEMQIKVKEMSVSHLMAEVGNEKRLDSIGSGTGDRIREAELAYQTGLMELEQLRLQLDNETKMRESSMRTKQLESSISSRRLQDMERTLDDARVKAPRKGTVTWLNKTIGASIGAGEKLAIVSDLSHLKIEGDIAESNAGKLSVGAPVHARINRRNVDGRISNISAQSENGMVHFTVFIDDDSDKLLRSGLHADLNVVYDTHDSVVIIPNGPYFKGEGEYTLFVMTPDGGAIESRSVILGDSNFDFVEVLRGIKPGEKVVISDMKKYASKTRLSLK